MTPYARSNFHVVRIYFPVQGVIWRSKGKGRGNRAKRHVYWRSRLMRVPKSPMMGA